MKLLAIDSATEACSTALWLHGEVISRIGVWSRTRFVYRRTYCHR